MSRCSALLCFTALLSPFRASASLLVNGGFEDPNLPVGTDREFGFGETIGSGWVVTSNFPFADPYLIDKDLIIPGVDLPHPLDGHQFLYLNNHEQGSSQIEQVVSLTAATNYSFTFGLADFLNDVNPGRVYIDVIEQSSGLSVLGGPALFQTALDQDFAVYDQEFTSQASGVYRIQFTSLPATATLLDDVQLNPVPEPPAMGTLSLALLALVLRRRENSSPSAKPRSGLR